ncbi:cadmium resistance transporter [Patulibacter sp.]|uniref:cadmium resistance transporter n=1 Tax=Patulibacter sp. TaxID=1912859 RepID=UPI00272632B7|nr:cadmium resistance transporter [Patulibacter sp.]MDO9408032.1 cadmium resistance transporter [Patulibacter sp.]
MIDLLGVVVAAAGAFVATNVDDVIVLTALFAVAAGDGPLRARHVVVGQAVGLGLFVAVAAVAAAGLSLVTDDVVGLLGLVPLALGILGLAALLRGSADEGATPAPVVRGVLGVAAVTVAGGADNIAVYVPFLAAQDGPGAAVVVVVFAVLLGVWLAATHRLAGRPLVARTIGRRGHVLVPVVLIALGLVILAESGLLGSALDGVTG